MNELTITKKAEDNALTVWLEGRIDTVTSSQFDDEVSQSLDGVTALTLDCSRLDFISSAGLRVILSLYRTMTAKQGTMKLCGVSRDIREIFIMTGFIDFLNIE